MASRLSLDVGYLFVAFQCLPLNDCSIISCDSDVLARGSESTSFYSTVLNQSPFLLFMVVLMKDKALLDDAQNIAFTQNTFTQ